ncbi:MAG: peptide MFS transporter [Pseudomonadota bacterium]
MSEGPRAQPKALYYLLATQGFASFAFYNTLALFVLYLTRELGFADSEAFLIFGTYVAFAYLSDVAGGLLADRLLGFRNCICTGLLMVSLGYFLLLSDSNWGLFVALATAAVGRGFFGSNIAAMLGSFYDEHDTRRDSGFTYFYMGINCGSLLAFVGAGILATQIDYKVAFCLSGVGATLGLVVFLAGRRHYDRRGIVPEASPLRGDAGRRVSAVLAVGGACMLAIVGTAFLIRFNLVGGQILAVFSAGFFGYFLFEMVGETRVIRKKLYAFLILVFFAVIFGILYQQSNASVVLYIAREVDLEVSGILVPPSDVGSLNPFFVLILAPIFALVWRRMATVGRAVSIPGKFTIGLMLLAASYGVLSMDGLFSGVENDGSLFRVVLYFLLLTMGELCLSPIGLAMAAALAPQRLRGFAMGLWMLSHAISDYLAGLISGWAHVPSETDLEDSRVIYEEAFIDYGLICIASALILLALVPILKRLMGRQAIGT